jgi:hypothetical protein
VRTFVLDAHRQARSTGTRVYFTRAPSQFVGSPEGFRANGAVNYLGGELDLSKITVVTIHRTPTFFDNSA